MAQAAIALLLLMLVPPTAIAQAEKCIALVIGNQAYATEIGPLKNPLKDIRSIGAALTKVGFEVRCPIAGRKSRPESLWRTTSPTGCVRQGETPSAFSIIRAMALRSAARTS